MALIRHLNRLLIKVRGPKQRFGGHIKKSHPKAALFGVVGETGFEPATSGSQNQRSTKLSYSPPLMRAGNCVSQTIKASRNLIEFSIFYI